MIVQTEFRRMLCVVFVDRKSSLIAIDFGVNFADV